MTTTTRMMMMMVMIEVMKLAMVTVPARTNRRCQVTTVSDEEHRSKPAALQDKPPIPLPHPPTSYHGTVFSPMVGVACGTYRGS